MCDVSVPLDVEFCFLKTALLQRELTEVSQDWPEYHQQVAQLQKVLKTDFQLLEASSSTVRTLSLDPFPKPKVQG